MKRIILTIISLNVLSLFSYSNSWKGLGTEDEPYLISSPQQMAELAEEVNNGTDCTGNNNMRFSALEFFGEILGEINEQSF